MILFTATILLVISILVYVVQNPGEIPVHFFKFSIQLSQAWVGVILVLAGMYLYSIWQAIWNVNTKRILIEFGKKLVEMEEEIKRKDARIAELTCLLEGQSKTSEVRE